jgi:hypothetical protein
MARKKDYWKIKTMVLWWVTFQIPYILKLTSSIRVISYEPYVSDGDLLQLGMVSESDFFFWELEQDQEYCFAYGDLLWDLQDVQDPQCTGDWQGQILIPGTLELDRLPTCVKTSIWIVTVTWDGVLSKLQLLWVRTAEVLAGSDGEVMHMSDFWPLVYSLWMFYGLLENENLPSLKVPGFLFHLQKWSTFCHWIHDLKNS